LRHLTRHELGHLRASANARASAGGVKQTNACAMPMHAYDRRADGTHRPAVWLDISRSTTFPDMAGAGIAGAGGGFGAVLGTSSTPEAVFTPC